VPPQEPIAVRAYAFATTFKLRELGPLFEGAESRLALDEMFAEWPDGGGAAVVFDFGAVVFFGVEPGRRDRVVEKLLSRHPAEPHPPLTEDYSLEVRPGAPAEALFDRVVVPALSSKVMGIVALLLAQSVAMDYYEEDVAEVLTHVDTLTRELARAGRLRGRVQDLLRFIGGCIQTKDGIIETLALFDKPDETWEDEALDRLYMRLREQLEIGDRFRALEYKLRMIQDDLVLLVDLSRQRHTLFLETGVLVLIVIEVLVMFWQVFGMKAH
jgi:uncharacterized Rmd1/YagE family protein